MDRHARWFVGLSLLYLATGGAMGVLMVLAPELRPRIFVAHVHVNLVGWVSMMIFGVAYHVLPRFSGNAVYSRGMAWAHLGLVNAGLALFALGSVWAGSAGATAGAIARGAQAAGAVAMYASFLLFTVNIFMSVRSRPAPAGERPWVRPAGAFPPPPPLRQVQLGAGAALNNGRVSPGGLSPGGAAL